MEKENASIERKKKKKERVQQLFIERAEHHFLSNGYEQTSLEAITEELGYTKRTFYAYFKDKEEIFAAVTLRALGTLYEKLSHAAAQKKKGLHQLNAIGYAFYDYAKAFPNHFGFNQIFDLKNYVKGKYEDLDEQREFTRACHQKNDQITDLVREAIVLGQEDGSIQSQTSPDSLLLFMFGATFGILHILRRQTKYLGAGKEAQNDQYFSDAIQLMTQSIRKPS